MGGTIMRGTVLVYGTLLAIIVVLYYVSKSSKKDGWSRNLLQKLGMGLSTEQTPTRQHDVEKAMEADVERVLQEIYEDFHTQMQALRKDVTSAVKVMHEQFAERMETLEHQVQLIKQPIMDVSKTRREEPVVDVSALEAAASVAPETGQDVHEPNYFKILDQIQQGIATEQIAIELGVELEQVRLVKKLMTSP
jgi:predicted metalloendopeptidase